MFPDLLRLDLHVYMQVVRNDVRRQATTNETIVFCGVLLHFDTSVSVFEKGPNGSGTWHREKEADEWTSGRRGDRAKQGGKKGSKGSKLGSKGKGKGKGKDKNKTRYCYNCREQEEIGVNCPYKRANSTDEEDDRTSSWESEPEGEKAEEVASLQTLDEEGVWCWPEKSGVTRWRRRIDSRPAFHYVAEDDEDEQASRGLNHLASRNAGRAQWTWKKVTVVVDSGAAENVMPRSMFPEVGIRQTERSKNGKGFKGPGRKHQKLWAARPVRQDPTGIRAQEHMVGRGREKASGVGVTHHPSWERSIHWEGRGVHHEQEEGEVNAQNRGECARA